MGKEHAVEEGQDKQGTLGGGRIVKDVLATGWGEIKEDGRLLAHNHLPWGLCPGPHEGGRMA